jgi:hypothetical protein
MPDGYVTLAEAKETRELRGTNYADYDLEAALDAASRAIDRICGRRFWLDADSAQVRYYTPRSPSQLYIDDLAVLTTLQVDRDGDGTFEEDWAVNADFVLDPLNAAADGEPYTLARAHPFGEFGGFPEWLPRSVKVTGQFGWPAVPAQINTATSILASRLLERRRSAPLGIVAVGVDAAIRLGRTDPDVLGLVDDLKRTDPMVA